MKKLILLIMIITMSVSVFAVGTIVPPQNAKYQFTNGLTYQSCDFKPMFFNGTPKIDYKTNDGYMSMNHRTNQMQCYQLIGHRGNHKKNVSITPVVIIPPTVEPTCETITKLYCDKDYTLKGDNCEKKVLEKPLCNWPYNLNNNDAWCVRPYHTPKTPLCNQGNFKIIDHHGYCEVTKIIAAQKEYTEVCS